MKLQAAGIAVFVSEHRTIGENRRRARDGNAAARFDRRRLPRPSLIRSFRHGDRPRRRAIRVLARTTHRPNRPLIDLGLAKAAPPVRSP